MAAYAALVSLFNTLHPIHDHPRFSTSFDKHQIQSLGAHIDVLLHFVETYNIDGDLSLEGAAQELKKKIVCAAHEAEDIIESHIVNLILPESADILDARLHHRCLFGLQKVIQDMDSIKEEVLKIKVGSGFNNQKPTNSTPSASSMPLTTEQNKMVGFGDELKQLLDLVIVQQSSRQIISIEGMGGSGKTTLAKNVYEDSITMHHFVLRAWATISQEYNVRDILLQLLSVAEGTVDELGEQLHKNLFGRRYLIILDDVWSVEVLDRLKLFFPDNANGSRIILTTRLSNLASICIKIKILDDNKGWNLFCQKVFGQEDCPCVELVEIGKRIVEQCKGLPLSIVVIGGLLKKSPRTEEQWQNVAKNINAIFNSAENGQCLDVLYLSYSHLPSHLKPCFLYTGTFKEDTEIRVSKIIRLWVAEGFLKPNGVQTLEQMAGDYLNDLTDRNLILALEYSSKGRMKSFRIHDLLRELCLRVADKEDFFCVVTADRMSRGICRERRLIFDCQNSNDLAHKVFESLRSASLVRSVIRRSYRAPVKCRLLRVLRNNCWDAFEIQNVNLRYFDGYDLPSSLSLIWNAQTLNLRGDTCAPLAIWKLTQLRHLTCYLFLLPDPPLSDEEGNSCVLGNLQTLTRVLNFRLSEETCKRIPNIKKLHLKYIDTREGYDVDSFFDTLQNLGRLHKLESLELDCFEMNNVPIKNAFPSSLQKLVLSGCHLNWDDLSTIAGSLHQLEVLKLEWNYSEVYTWRRSEGGFPRLKFLSINGVYLTSWTLDGPSCFPVLEKLVLVRFQKLNEFPSGIGEIPTLQLILLDDCDPSVAIWAMKIKEEQESFGNYDLLIQAKMYDDDDAALRLREMRLREMVEIEGLSINNIHLERISLISFGEKRLRDMELMETLLCLEVEGNGNGGDVEGNGGDRGVVSLNNAED